MPRVLPPLRIFIVPVVLLNIVVKDRLGCAISVISAATAVLCIRPLESGPTGLRWHLAIFLESPIITFLVVLLLDLVGASYLVWLLGLLRRFLIGHLFSLFPPVFLILKVIEILHWVLISVS